MHQTLGKKSKNPNDDYEGLNTTSQASYSFYDSQLGAIRNQIFKQNQFLSSSLRFSWQRLLHLSGSSVDTSNGRKLNV